MSRMVWMKVGSGSILLRRVVTQRSTLRGHHHGVSQTAFMMLSQVRGRSLEKILEQSILLGGERDLR
jgi:hypothetical protein